MIWTQFTIFEWAGHDIWNLFLEKDIKSGDFALYLFEFIQYSLLFSTGNIRNFDSFYGEYVQVFSNCHFSRKLFALSSLLLF